MRGLGQLFIFEGPDYSGKTTLALALSEYLRSKGIDCDYCAFPGKESGTLGRLVYELHHGLEATGIRTINATSLQLMHIAAHVDTIESRILPALKTGRNIVLDRFWWSTLVYGTVGGANREMLLKMVELEQICWADHAPAAIFLLQRLNQRNSPMTETGWKAVSDEYHRVASQETGNYPIHYVRNDGDVADSLTNVIKHIHLSEELS